MRVVTSGLESLLGRRNLVTSNPTSFLGCTYPGENCGATIARSRFSDILRRINYGRASVSFTTHNPVGGLSSVVIIPILQKKEVQRD